MNVVIPRPNPNGNPTPGVGKVELCNRISVDLTLCITLHQGFKKIKEDSDQFIS